MMSSGMVRSVRALGPTMLALLAASCVLPFDVVLRESSEGCPSLDAEDPYPAGTVYVVAPNGEDSNPGTEAAPLRTIQKAIDLAQAGTTILVRAGSYFEDLRIGRSGSASSPISLRNFPREKPTIDFQASLPSTVRRLLLQAQEGEQYPIGWITIEGLEFVRGWEAIKFYNGHDLVIRRNAMHDCLGSGILGNGTRVTIDRNEIASNGLPGTASDNGVYGINATGTDFVIANNLIHSTRAFGIQLAGYTFANNPGAAYAGPEYQGASQWLVANNTFAFNKNRPGIAVWLDGATDNVFENNLFYQNALEATDDSPNGISFVGSGGGNVLRNNLFYSPTRVPVSDSGNSYTATGAIEQDPLFVDPASLDFHLQALSPAIDRGDEHRGACFRLRGAQPAPGRTVRSRRLRVQRLPVSDGERALAQRFGGRAAGAAKAHHCSGKKRQQPRICHDLLEVPERKSAE